MAEGINERAKAVENVWNKTTLEKYDEHMRETAHYAAQEKIAGALDSSIGRKVLMVGTGPGFLDGYLLDRDRQVTMVDVSKVAMLKSWEKYHRFPAASFSRQDALTMHFIDETFNTVIFCNSFYYFKPEEREALLQNCKKYLEPGGTCVAIEEFPFVISLEQAEKDSVLGVHYHDISPDDMKALFETQNLILEQREKAPIDETPDHTLYGSVFRSA